MLSLLLCKGRSFEYVCESPLKTPPPVEGATLISASLLFRHGMRTTFDRYEYNGSETWLCDRPGAEAPRMRVGRTGGFKRRYHKVIPPHLALFPPNCDSAELLVEGMQQHKELGAMYHDYFIERGMLPEYFDPTFVTVRTSKIERCIQSAMSFINGFYPPATPGELINIKEVADGTEILSPEPHTCKETQEMYTEWLNSNKFKERRAKSEALYREAFKAMHIEESQLEWMFFGDWLISYTCKGFEIPSVVTQEMFDQAVKDIGYYSWGYFGTRPKVGSSAMWRLFLKDMDRFLAGDPGVGKLRLYSGHDTSIIALIAGLGMTGETVPPFRSHFLMETWLDAKGKLLLRLVLNGEPLAIPFMENQVVVDYAAFKGKLSELGFLSHCLDAFPA